MTLQKTIIKYAGTTKNKQTNNPEVSQLHEPMMKMQKSNTLTVSTTTAILLSMSIKIGTHIYQYSCPVHENTNIYG